MSRFSCTYIFPFFLLSLLFSYSLSYHHRFLPKAPKGKIGNCRYVWYMHIRREKEKDNLRDIKNRHHERGSFSLHSVIVHSNFHSCIKARHHYRKWCMIIIINMSSFIQSLQREREISFREYTANQIITSSDKKNSWRVLPLRKVPTFGGLTRATGREKEAVSCEILFLVFILTSSVFSVAFNCNSCNSVFGGAGSAAGAGILKAQWEMKNNQLSSC